MNWLLKIERICWIVRNAFKNVIEILATGETNNSIITTDGASINPRWKKKYIVANQLIVGDKRLSLLELFESDRTEKGW